MQLKLGMKPEMMQVDDQVIAAQPSMTKALMLCQQLSGLDDQQFVGGRSGIVGHLSQWSRIKTGQHHFPQDRLGDYMDLCGNEAPLQWLARSRGYLLTPLESEMERRLRLERERVEKLQAENALLQNLLMGRGR